MTGMLWDGKPPWYAQVKCDVNLFNQVGGGICPCAVDPAQHNNLMKYFSLIQMRK